MKKSQEQLLNGINELIKQFNAESEGHEKIAHVTEVSLEQLIGKVEDYEKDVADLVYVIESVIKFLGLTDEKTGKLRQEYYENEETGEKGESPLPAVLSSAIGLVSLMTQAQVPVLGRAAKKEFEQKFSFIEKLLPLLKKYT